MSDPIVKQENSEDGTLDKVAVKQEHLDIAAQSITNNAAGIWANINSMGNQKQDRTSPVPEVIETIPLMAHSIFFTEEFEDETTTVHKPRRHSWDRDKMRAAIEACRSKTMGFLKAQKTFKVPRGTLRRFILRLDSDPSLRVEDVLQTPLGRKPVFSHELEKQLASHCKELERRFHGVTISDVRVLAYQLAAANNVPNTFNKDSKTAGRKWLEDFLRRNPEVTLKLRGVAVPRENSDSTKVSKFYDDLETEYRRYSYDPDRIFSCDVTGLLIDLGKQPIIISKKSGQSIFSLSYMERKSLVTMVSCANAAGFYVPPLLVFSCKDITEKMRQGAPPGAILEAHKSGWVQMEMFSKWLNHFVRTVRACQENPVILILDGSYPHVRNLDVLLMAKEHHVVIVCLPPHHSDKLDPLNVAFLEPFKVFYDGEIRNWSMMYGDQPLTQLQLPELIGRAYEQAATRAVAVEGFGKTGIYPLNRYLLQTSDFADVKVEDSQLEDSPKDGDSCEDDDDCLINLLATPKSVEVSESKKKSYGDASNALSNDSNTNSTNEPSTSSRSLGKRPHGFPTSRNKTKKKTGRLKKVSLEPECNLNDYSEDCEINETDSTGDDSDTDCLYCGKLWSRCIRGRWLRCHTCLKWAHYKCAGFPKKEFYCATCKK